MATYTASAAQPGIQPRGLRVGLVARTVIYSVGASQAAGDVIQMCKVPAGATPVFMLVQGVTVSGSKVFKVGDGITPGRYIAAGSISVGGFTQNFLGNGVNYVPYTYTTDDTIDITLSTLSISATAASGGYNLTAIFSMDAV